MVAVGGRFRFLGRAGIDAIDGLIKEIIGDAENVGELCAQQGAQKVKLHLPISVGINCHCIRRRKRVSLGIRDRLIEGG